MKNYASNWPAFKTICLSIWLKSSPSTSKYVCVFISCCHERCLLRAPVSLSARLPVCSPVCLRHLWVLVVSWHGWPMSLWVGDGPGLKYSSAVSAAGLVTAGHDIWVTRAWEEAERQNSNGARWDFKELTSPTEAVDGGEHRKRFCLDRWLYFPSRGSKSSPPAGVWMDWHNDEDSPLLIQCFFYICSSLLIVLLIVFCFHA